MAAEIPGEYRLRPDQVHLQVHYVGPIPGVNETPGGLSVLTATAPVG